ncbi:MAG: hypothetical protein HZA91_19485 [Verrucomicrobia bacterium]|nr:hypothetical protein [Verrucomicrobiota bacterium]
MISPEEHPALRETLVATGRAVLLMLVAALLLLGYGVWQFNGLKHADAMDQAQIGRNLARGEGFTTYFIRPLSIWKTTQHAGVDAKRLFRHSDLVYPPLYPALIGALFYIVEKGGLEPPAATSPGGAKAAPSAAGGLVARLIGWRHWSLFWFLAAVVWMLWLVLRATRFSVLPTHVPRHAAGAVICALLGGLFWAKTVSFEVGPPGAFTVFGPDRWIAYGLGIPLMLLNCALVYGTAHRLFDRRVALMAACLFGLAETTFQFALSGLSTMLTMAWVSAAWLALIVASDWRETGARPRGAVVLALAAAVAIAGAFLTHYAAGWLLLPLCVVAWRTWGLARGAAMAAAMGAVFVALVSPWLARNYSLSGNFLGLAGYAVSEHTPMTPGDMFQRLMDAKPVVVSMKMVWAKALANASVIWSDCPWIGSYGIILSLFVAVLFYKFRRPVVNRFKWLAAASWALLFVVWCFVGLGARPERSAAQADNLLVLLVPFVTVFSTAVFYAYFDGLRILFKSVRAAWITGLVLVAALPLLLRLAGPTAGRMAYPPYHPPLVSQIAGYVEPGEFIISDQPWAVAWYGDRRCFWIPFSVPEFFTLNDMHQHVAAFMLTPVTLNSRMLTEILVGEWAPWSATLGFLKFPNEFPLKYGRLFVGPDKRPVSWNLKGAVDLNELINGVHVIVLCDTERWKSRPAAVAPVAPPPPPQPQPAGASKP